jgi:large subunit ribosomal protein L10
MRRDQKEHVVQELAERLRATETLIVADYRGLSMTEIDGVRSELISQGARFTVVKNTLTKRAADQAGLPELNELLDGPTAIAFVNEGDMVAVAKTLNETARRTRVLELKGGILQGKPMTAAQVRDLASLPPAEQLRGQVLGAIVAPLNAIAGLINAPLQNLLGLIDARIEQLGGSEETTEEPVGAGQAPAEAEEAAEEPVGAGLVPPAEEAAEEPVGAGLVPPAEEAAEEPVGAGLVPPAEAEETAGETTEDTAKEQEE